MLPAYSCLTGDLQLPFFVSCWACWDALKGLMERSMYRDSKTTLSVSWDAQVDSVEGPQGQLLNGGWLAALIAL